MDPESEPFLLIFGTFAQILVSNIRMNNSSMLGFVETQNSQSIINDCYFENLSVENTFLIIRQSLDIVILSNLIFEGIKMMNVIDLESNEQFAKFVNMSIRNSQFESKI